MSHRTMKRVAAACAAALILFFPGTRAQAGEGQGRLEIFVGQSSIRDPLFKTVYLGTPRLYGVTVSGEFLFHLEFYFSIKAFRQSGILSYSQESTRLIVIPVSFGLRYVLPSKVLQPYLGGGSEVSIFYESNVIGTVWDYARGFHLLGGLFLQPFSSFPVALGVQLKYADVKAKTSGGTIDLGGWECGAMLAFRF